MIRAKVSINFEPFKRFQNTGSADMKLDTRAGKPITALEEKQG